MNKPMDWTTILVTAMVVALLAYTVRFTGGTDGFVDAGRAIGEVLAALLGRR